MRQEASRRFEDLVMWQRSHCLVLEIYRLSSGFPPRELYGLSAQIRRSAVSIPANIAEGFAKRSRVDKARFMNIAQASLEETRYYLILSGDLGYCPPRMLATEVDEIGRLLTAYSRTLLTPNS